MVGVGGGQLTIGLLAFWTAIYVIHDIYRDGGWSERAVPCSEASHTSDVYAAGLQPTTGAIWSSCTVHTMREMQWK